MSRVVVMAVTAALIGCGSNDDADPACARWENAGPLGSSRGPSVDMLLVVDDAPSMVEEQAALQRELPHLVQFLAQADPDGDGHLDFAPPHLQIGVVSADLGAAGAEDAPASCFGDGDGARLLRGNGEAPAVLTFDYRTDDPEQLASAVADRTQLGAAGCSYPQPLEAALAALQQDATRLIDHGDEGSLVSIVIVTDSDDCSTSDPSLIAANEPAQARCGQNPDRLLALERYTEDLRSLRPGDQRLVALSVIAGVPQDYTIDLFAASPFDPATFADDPDAYYRQILSDPRMQLSADNDEPAGLSPACENENGKATPARRLVQLARSFGAQGGVASICGADFTPALRPIVAQLAERLAIACGLRAERKDGVIGCKVLWELPPAAEARPGTPTDCAERPFLVPLTERPARTAAGGRICELRQLAVTEGSGGPKVAPGDGWYYDDFTALREWYCQPGPGWILPTPGAEPPPDVRARVMCPSASTCSMRE